ncbi:hypothetical protein MMC25_001289 [Agyrium rufum]|nr:hypothetical protein [Agyrium rufum]
MASLLDRRRRPAIIPSSTSLTPQEIDSILCVATGHTVGSLEKETFVQPSPRLIEQRDWDRRPGISATKAVSTPKIYLTNSTHSDPHERHFSIGTTLEVDKTRVHHGQEVESEPSILSRLKNKRSWRAVSESDRWCPEYDGEDESLGMDNAVAKQFEWNSCVCLALNPTRDLSLSLKVDNFKQAKRLGTGIS